MDAFLSFSLQLIREMIVAKMNNFLKRDVVLYYEGQVYENNAKKRIK
jgi:hypothetical protein